MGGNWSRFWPASVLGVLLVIGPLVLNRVFSVHEELCLRFFIAGAMQWLMYTFHPCIFNDRGNAVIQRCFICDYVHNRAPFLKHWLFLLHCWLLTSVFTYQAISTNGDEDMAVLMLFSAGCFVYDMVFWYLVVI